MFESVPVPAPSSTDDTILERRFELTGELVKAHRELAFLLAAEKEGRVASWHEAGEQLSRDTLGARDRIAEFNTIPLTKDILILKGDIAAMIEERDYLDLLLSRRREIVS